MTKTVLVTGISGFIATHCARELLEKGYAVRGTLRSANRADKVRQTLEKAVPGCSRNISFIEADLMQDKGWAEAVSGCDAILHVASPFPASQPKDENDLIKPAREGTLRVLNAAAAAGVERIVITSSMVAVYEGNTGKGPLTEKHWSQLSGAGVNAYAKSKTLAEKAAWDFVASEHGRNLKLSTVNPGLVLGPAMNDDFGTSLDILKMLMTGSMPAVPRLMMPIVDVRDVAKIHVASLEHDAAIGHRFLAVESCRWFKDLGKLLKQNFPTHKIPTSELPDFMVKFLANFRSDLKSAAGNLGMTMEVDNSPARKTLGIDFYGAEEMLKTSAQSLIDCGAVKP